MGGTGPGMGLPNQKRDAFDDYSDSDSEDVSLFFFALSPFVLLSFSFTSVLSLVPLAHSPLRSSLVLWN
jgi:hypothetical protein